MSSVEEVRKVGSAHILVRAVLNGQKKDILTLAQLGMVFLLWNVFDHAETYNRTIFQCFTIAQIYVHLQILFTFPDF